jgi:hypothetical protein
VKSEQASSASYDDEYDDELAWLQEVGNPYRSMVAAAVAEHIVGRGVLLSRRLLGAPDEQAGASTDPADARAGAVG